MRERGGSASGRSGPGGSRPTRVGLLTYGLDRPLSGTTRVALELGRALLELADVEVTFLTPYRRGAFANERGVRCAYLPGCRLLPGLLTLGPVLIEAVARRRQLDVVHDPIGIAPFLPRQRGGPRRVVTVHDAIAFRYPSGYPWLNRLLHRNYLPRTVRWVDALATVSAHARDELETFLEVDSRRVRVIPNGVSRSFRPVGETDARAVAARHGLTGPYVLYVGAFQARKNLPRLVEAFRRAGMPGTTLALAGPRQWRYPELEAVLADPTIGANVRVLGHVAEADLPALYSGAAAAALPSLYEGFGIPALEAMACGTPVVCSNVSSLPEVVGDAALQADPRDVDDLAAALRRVVADPDLVAELRRRGLARADQFTWARAAEAYAGLYRELARDRAEPQLR